MKVFKKDRYIHNSELKEKKDRKIQIWVTETCYNMIDALRSSEKHLSITSFMSHIINQYVYQKQGSEKSLKDIEK